MKRGIAVLSMVGIALGAFALGRAGAQEGPDSGKSAEVEMAAWLELGKTGPEHAELMKGAGHWTVETKTWIQPGAEPIASKGEAVFTALLGGRFLRQEFEGAFMGQPFHGIGCSGFNNATRKYEDVWIDNSGTGLMVMTGTETEPGKVWTYAGTCTGPDGKEMHMRTVLRRMGGDRMVIASYCDCAGAEPRKCWEGTYTRSK